MAEKARMDQYDMIDEVPYDLGITRVDDCWYLTSTHGEQGTLNHTHQEIKLDETMLLRLYAEAERETLNLGPQAVRSAADPGARGSIAEAGTAG
jgi:hypothetical protein